MMRITSPHQPAWAKGRHTLSISNRLRFEEGRNFDITETLHEVVTIFFRWVVRFQMRLYTFDLILIAMNINSNICGINNCVRARITDRIDTPKNRADVRFLGGKVVEVQNAAVVGIFTDQWIRIYSITRIRKGKLVYNRRKIDHHRILIK